MKAFKYFLIILLLNISQIIGVDNNLILSNVNDQDWWKTTVFYQIYPRSFQDSNGDGVGDINGIRQRLGHLSKLGITATWLSPIYKSPMVDHGYDISDFRSIDPLFGTMDDFDKLLAEANELGIKIIMDFVPNHSSDKHEWFEKSVKRIEPYTDYYVWHDGKIVNGTQQPPNNWVRLYFVLNRNSVGKMFTGSLTSVVEIF